VTIDKSGNLYGTTYAHGYKGWGDVYRMKRTTAGGWTFRDVRLGLWCRLEDHRVAEIPRLFAGPASLRSDVGLS